MSTHNNVHGPGRRRAMSKRVPCSLCATPIEKDSNGVWIDPDAPDHLALVECPTGIETDSHTIRAYHDHYEKATR